MTAVAILHREEIIARVQAGEYVTKISREFGMSASTICERLRADPEYQAARETGMEVRLEKSLESIEAAGDDLNLARAREIQARRTEWRAEREFPHRWGAKQELTLHGGAPALQITIVQSHPSNNLPALECEPVASLPAK